ncbi:hypothetical protein FY557_13905 [Chryseobacterium sp. SN22]|nr:hypothetical protein FY557_13905 [Chryseobacterium sp. SN22]
MADMVLQDVNTTVHMTDLAIKLLNANVSRFLCLLFLFILFNCSNKSENKVIPAPAGENILPQSVSGDSLEIIIKNIPPQTAASLMYNDFDLSSKNIYFENTSGISRTVSQKILKPVNSDYTLLYRTFTMTDNKFVPHYHNYFIGQPVDRIEFVFNEKNGDIKLENNNGTVINYDNITNAYQEITRKTNKITALQKVRQIENLHADNKKNFTDNNLLSLNDLVFYKQLSLLSPEDKRIQNYLLSLEKPVWSTDLLGVIYQYLQAKKDSIYLLNLNKSKNSVYNGLIEIGIANHLVQYKEGKYPDYARNLEWFEDTEYYKNHKDSLKKLLETDKKPESVKNQILSFDVHDGDRVVKLKNVLSAHKSGYYLLDFWATWCIPCLQNIEAMHQMDLPKELEIFYISMDRTKDKEKWSGKARNMDLFNSYLFAETQNNKNIIRKINLNELPRYILLDKDFNVVHPNLATPQEADFLKELKTYMK